MSNLRQKSLYLSYIAFTMNKDLYVKKGEKVVSLYDLYSHFTKQQFPIKNNGMSINRVRICSNSKGCNPKTKTGAKDYLIGEIGTEGRINTTQLKNKSKYVLLHVYGTYLIGDIECAISMRIPSSSKVNITIGLSKQNVIKMDRKVDKKVTRLKSNLETIVLDIFGDYIKKQTDTKLSGKSVEGLNLFGKYPEYKMKNFLELCRLIGDDLEEYSINETSVIKESKHLPKISFVSKNPGILPTIGLTTWGTIDFKGGTGTFTDIIDITAKLIEIFDKHKQTIVFDKSSKRIVQKTSECRKGQPLAMNGKCPDSMIPYPSKSKALCCKKKKLTKSVATNIMKQYANANIEIPNSLKLNINKILNKTKMKPMSSIKTKPMSSIKNQQRDILSYRENKKKWYYKSKVFNCMILSKTELLKISRKLQVNPDGFKKVLCERILKKLKEMK